jgi:CheY-like chemotaxis protein
MRRVLVLEDDDLQREAIVRGLSKLEEVIVISARTVGEATELFRMSPPAVIVSDLDLPDGSGLQMLSEVARAGGGIPIIYVSAYLAELDEWIPRRPDVDLMPKPADLERLRLLVADRLQSAGREAKPPFTIDDYLHLACSGRQAMLIKLEDNEKLVGEIYVRSGEVWSAVDTNGEGFEALERMRKSAASAIVTQWADEVIIEEPIDVRTGEAGGDEADIDVDVVEDPVAPPIEDPPPVEEAPPPIEESHAEEGTLERWLDEGVDAVLRRDFQAALEAYERAARIAPDNAQVRGNIERLKRLTSKKKD